MLKIEKFLIIVLMVVMHSNTDAQNSPINVSFKTTDEIEVFAYWHPVETDKTSKTIVLFHQAGASAMGEYKEIIPTLLKQNMNVLAVDLRSGGSRFGGVNRTADSIKNNEFGYCEAYPDIEASLQWLKDNGNTGPIILWGSSYSAGLVYQAAAKNPETVSAILAFSPASGGPMADCRPDLYLDQIQIPTIAFRPEVEMQYDSVKLQAELFKSKGFTYISIADGVHGSSMLVKERTKKDMSHAWSEVFSFIKKIENKVAAITTVNIEVDGWILFGDLTFPSVSKNSGLPTALLLNQAAGNRQAYDKMAEELASKGIASLKIDLRAHGESVNKGRFKAPYRENRYLLQNTDNDIIAALAFLNAHPKIDSENISVVGASYSGEYMAKAARKTSYAKNYIALSPGSFSEESISNINSSHRDWLFVRATEELPFFDSIFDSIKKNSHAEIMILEGKSHATDLFDLDKNLSLKLVNWIASR